jgi:hypothetical protein
MGKNIKIKVNETGRYSVDCKYVAAKNKGPDSVSKWQTPICPPCRHSQTAWLQLSQLFCPVRSAMTKRDSNQGGLVVWLSALSWMWLWHPSFASRHATACLLKTPEPSVWPMDWQSKLPNNPSQRGWGLGSHFDPLDNFKFQPVKTTGKGKCWLRMLENASHPCLCQVLSRVFNNHG